jgi:hypothetical protein
MSKYERRTAQSLLLALCAAATLGGVVLADHSWGNYHWARTTSSFNLVVVNSTTNDWDPFVTRALSDWSASGKLNMGQTNGGTSDLDRRQCRSPEGGLRICNQAYGSNGWLGVAGISIDSRGHIVTGYTKLNDTYFTQSFYNTPAWKQSVTCQELGHNVGLDHQDENFNNTSVFSCMDYQNPPFEYPNSHDYAQLDAIYAHLDSYNSYAGGDGGGGGGGTCNSPQGKGCNKADVGQGNGRADWGLSLGRHNGKEKFLRIDPDGTRHLTFVTWVDGH